MYEIWLATNIVYEVALLHWPWLAAYLAIWLILWILVWRQHPYGRRFPLGRLCLVWLGGTIAALLAVPYLSGAELSDLAYWVDWANLFAIAAGCGGALALLVWPLSHLLPCRCQAH